LITGGAGFLGANLAHRLLGAGEPVMLLDDLSRPGVSQNLEWLQHRHGGRVKLTAASVLDYETIAGAISDASQVFHFAAQVAVTKSIAHPMADFEVNARGTLHVLEALRSMDAPPPLVFTSTNKVYGPLTDVALRCSGERYEPEQAELRAWGVDEARALDFHSPYGCSKGTADQYVLDYARMFGIQAAVFRMSCIYGPRQHGTEDQGWLAHFLRCALSGTEITIYGDGRQVRDVLFIDDLVDALLAAQRAMPSIGGQAFNIGGGPDNSVSLLELAHMIEQLMPGKPLDVRFDTWRPGDQRYYVSDYRKFWRVTGWRPCVGVREGVRRLALWLEEAFPAASPSALLETGS
jgi:CDP-paratose 2-epimerase